MLIPGVNGAFSLFPSDGNLEYFAHCKQAEYIVYDTVRQTEWNKMILMLKI